MQASLYLYGTVVVNDSTVPATVQVLFIFGRFRIRDAINRPSVLGMIDCEEQVTTYLLVTGEINRFSESKS